MVASTASGGGVLTVAFDFGRVMPGAQRYDRLAYDAAAVPCQKTIGKAVRGYVAAKQNALGACLDTIAVVEARAHAGDDSANAETAAANARGDKMLATIEAARAKGEAVMLDQCLATGNLTSTSAAAHPGRAGCRAEERMSASYPGAQGLLAAFTAEGRPVDAHFPCVIPAPHVDGGSRCDD